MGVVTGPFNPTRVRSIDSVSSLGMYSLYFSKASAPEAKLSHSNLTPVASRIRTAACVTSGPMPSPGMRVILCAIEQEVPSLTGLSLKTYLTRHGRAGLSYSAGSRVDSPDSRATSSYRDYFCLSRLLLCGLAFRFRHVFHFQQILQLRHEL